MKTTILTFCLVLLGYTGLYSQGTLITSDTDKVFTIVQVAPKFPGDINKYLADSIQYPADASDKNIQGTVYVSFVVEKNGSLDGIKILRGIHGSSLDSEAMKVVSTMPKWEPGMQNGHPVRVQYIIPVRFILAGNNPSNQNKN